MRELRDKLIPNASGFPSLISFVLKGKKKIQPLIPFLFQPSLCFNQFSFCVLTHQSTNFFSFLIFFLNYYYYFFVCLFVYLLALFCFFIMFVVIVFKLMFRSLFLLRDFLSACRPRSVCDCRSICRVGCAAPSVRIAAAAEMCCCCCC